MNNTFKKQAELTARTEVAVLNKSPAVYDKPIARGANANLVPIPTETDTKTA